jgi:hypothetical protein
MGCHARVLAANLRRNTKGLKNEGSANFKRESGNRDVIKERACHPKPRQREFDCKQFAE